MANITFKYKGTQIINLTRNYNSLSVYVPNKDDVQFNIGVNDFSNYTASSSCGIWQNDKIKILSLPLKGRLFYLTNPSGGTPVYADVTVGQEIVVRDLNDNKVLKFSGEGNDGQFSDNYLSEFTFERYCGTTPSNIIVTTRLNMIDTKVAPPTIYASNVSNDIFTGITTFDIHVEGAAFNGYALGKMVNGSLNTGQKLSSISIPTASVSLTPKITSGRPVGYEDNVELPVSIPIGVYNGSITTNGGSIPEDEMIDVSTYLIFSNDAVYENGIIMSRIDAYYRRNAV